MKPKPLRVFGMRALRKTTHVGANVLERSSDFMRRVEHKSGKIIIGWRGSETGRPYTELDASFYYTYPMLLPIHPSLPNLGQKPSVTVLVPSLSGRGFYGGIATLLIAAGALANELDYDLRIVQTCGYAPDDGTLKFLAGNGVRIPGSRFSMLDISERSRDKAVYLPLHADDVVVVSAWWDAYNAAKLPLVRKFVYMVQDYEPIFYDNGDTQQLAESTYRHENFVPLINTSVLKDFFKEKKYAFANRAIYFEPAVAVGNGTVASKPTGVKRVFFYARPSVDRNLFYSGLLALQNTINNLGLTGSDIEICMAGQDDVPHMQLGGGIVARNLGKMSLEEYYDFARSVDVAISLMLAPHPNYPTLELASLGATVVTTAYETKRDLSRYAGNIILANASVDDLAAAITKALQMPHQKRVELAAKNHIPTSWGQSLNVPLKQVRKSLGL